MDWKENAFPLREGTKLTNASGAYVLSEKEKNSKSVLWCREDGTVSITYETTTIETEDMIVGDAIRLINVLSVEVVSGTFRIGS